ncbi:hypothetical protein [Fervidicoccus fontis]|nr:hypothetical protein [Fervidicoccus fontis]
MFYRLRGLLITSVLDVDIKTAVERKKDIVSLKELEFKRKLYLLLEYACC